MTERAARSILSNFLQRRAVSNHGSEDKIDTITQLLQTTSDRLGNSPALINLVTAISNQAPKGMEKIKTLIQSLITRLEKQAAAEGKQKAWCDKSKDKANDRKALESKKKQD